MTAGCAGRALLPDETVIFRSAGKVGVRSAGTGHSASYRWVQYTSGYEIEVWGPLGQGRVLLRGDLEYMVVTRGGEVLAAGEPVAMMSAHLGWTLPLEVLDSWVLGRPDPDFVARSIRRAPDGRLETFSQLGWEVRLSRYTERGMATTPGRILATNGVQKVTMTVREFLQ